MFPHFSKPSFVVYPTTHFSPPKAHVPIYCRTLGWHQKLHFEAAVYQTQDEVPLREPRFTSCSDQFNERQQIQEFVFFDVSFVVERFSVGRGFIYFWMFVLWFHIDLLDVWRTIKSATAKMIIDFNSTGQKRYKWHSFVLSSINLTSFINSQKITSWNHFSFA